MIKHRLKSAVVLILAAVTFAACAGTRQAYQSADTLDEHAFLASEHFNALQIEANDLAAAGAPQTLIDAMAAAEREARPIILELRAIAEAYKATRTAGTEAELAAALDRAALVLSDFVNAVNRSR